MKKTVNHFICDICGYETGKWFGKCPQCGEWNSAKEINIDERHFEGQTGLKGKGFVSIKNADLSKMTRYDTKLEHLNRVLGGGLVNGSVILIGGDPGVGKSTLVTQLCSKFKKSYYLSGEESFEQIYMRYKRVSEGDSEIKVMSSSYIDNAINFLERELEEYKDQTVVIVDSIQTMRTAEINSLPGGAVQIRECTSKLVEFAKTNNVPVIIIAHITKSGQIAGPKLVEHLVDVVLYFEGNNDTDLRILRSVKNRFGPTNEIGVFEMKEKGLHQVLDPSERFYDTESNLSGNSLGVIIEGNTPLVVEVQGLVVNAQFSTPRRLSKGINPERMALISAVLTKRLNIQVEKNDIFINLLGGMRTADPGIDFPVALSLYSSFTDRIFPKGTASFGEIGLDGKIRSVSFPEKRITELKRLGFTRVLVPSKTLTRISEKTAEGIDIVEFSTLQEALLKSFK
ncbi:MAG TPA: DNA repair protein RadA [Thermotogota bacterium]|nr:DNA repair protein RadA [Thermotogota bacterium]HPJ87968.1 DNA repair protein RadA [Thermotogota bacterium]HPR95055.1 DNA repair protein RadA [Thermotogota bacterium]